MSYSDLKGKCFIITGAAAGMGRTTALRLAHQGVHVGLLDLRKPDHVAEEIEGAGGPETLSLACDVTDAKQVDAAVKQVADKFGRLDGAANMAGWVGNQGLYGKAYALDVVTDEEWEAVVKVNLDGVKNCLRAELQNMKGSGAIVNAASIAGQYGPPYNAPYSVAKWGVISVSKCAAQENGHRDIRVNAVAPGVVDTALVHSLGTPAEVHDALLQRTALKRIAQPDEVSKVIAFLLSDESGYITSTVINVDAGYQ